jgi:hypothetical protein
MRVGELGRRDVVANVLSLFFSLIVAGVAVELLPIEGPSGPGTFQRGTSVVIFFTVYTLLFALYVSHEPQADEN